MVIEFTMRTSKPNILFTSSSLGWSSKDDVIPLFIVSHGLRLDSKAYIMCLEESVLLWVKRVAAGNRTLQHAMQTRRFSVGWEKISATTSSLTSGCLTPQIAISLIMCGVWLSEKPTKLCPTARIKARIIAAFTNLNKETIGKICRRFQSHLEVMVEANGYFFEYIW